MVKKLLKHELYALFRILLFFAVAVVVLAIAGRVLVYFSISNGSVQLSTLSIFVVSFYVMAISAFAVAAYVMGINRFYKTLFTGEGYMTLSLPASAAQLIWAKLLSALIGVFFASAVSLLSLVVFFVGWDAQTMRAIIELFSLLGEAISYIAQTEPLLFAEYVVLFIVSLPMGLLVLYAIISVGQLFTARRKLMTFAIGIGVYFVVNSIISMVADPVLTFFANVSPHLAVWVNVLWVLAVEVGCFFLIRYILRNKVNLIA